MQVEQRGKTRYLRVNSDPKQDTGESHAPVPFYVSSKGYGVLVDTSHIVSLYLGSTVRKDSSHPPVCRNSTDDPAWKATMLSDCVEATFIGEGAQLYLFAGPDMKTVVQRYNLFCGGGTLPPLWALGFWHRVPSIYSQQEAVNEAKEFRRRGFPLDVLGLEPGWHSTNYPDSFLWHKKRFPDPKGFSGEMQQLDIHVNNWEHAWVSPEAPFYKAIEPYCGTHTVWGGLAPDFSLPQVQKIFQDQHAKDHLAFGVSGYKLDECDGSELTDCSWMFPPQAQFPSGQDGEQMRQNYGLLMQKTMDDLFRREGKRTFGLVRASGTGAPPLPFVLYSDLYDHRQYITALYNSSFSGLLWTPEVRKAKDKEDWVRRIQSVVFSPLALLNAWGDKTKPWTFEEVTPIVKKYLNLRMRLIPYLYTTYAQYHYEGIPVVRSMELMFGDLTTKLSKAGHKEFDSTDAPYGRTRTFEFCDQYMLGDSLLVAPLFAKETGRQVYLPEGLWYAFETKQEYIGGKMVEITCSLETMPIFVKEGTLLPLMPPLSHVPDSSLEKLTDLTVLSYGNTQGKTTRIYEDDGVSFAYEQGQGTWITLTHTEEGLQINRTGKPRLWGSITLDKEGLPC